MSKVFTSIQILVVSVGLVSTERGLAQENDCINKVSEETVLPARKDASQKSSYFDNAGVSSDGERVFQKLNDGSVIVREVIGGKTWTSPSQIKASAKTIEFSPDGKTIAIKYESGEVVMHSFKNGVETILSDVGKMQIGSNSDDKVRFSGDSSKLIVGARRNLKLTLLRSKENPGRELHRSYSVQYRGKKREIDLIFGQNGKGKHGWNYRDCAYVNGFSSDFPQPRYWDMCPNSFFVEGVYLVDTKTGKITFSEDYNRETLPLDSEGNPADQVSSNGDWAVFIPKVPKEVFFPKSTEARIFLKKAESDFKLVNLRTKEEKAFSGIYGESVRFSPDGSQLVGLSKNSLELVDLGFSARGSYGGLKDYRPGMTLEYSLDGKSIWVGDIHGYNKNAVTVNLESGTVRAQHFFALDSGKEFYADSKTAITSGPGRVCAQNVNSQIVKCFEDDASFGRTLPGLKVLRVMSDGRVHRVQLANTCVASTDLKAPEEGQTEPGDAEAAF